MRKIFKTIWLRVQQSYRSVSLRFKIAFLVVVLLTSTSFVLSVVTVQIMNNYILNEIIKRGESVGKSIAASAGYNLLSKDLLALDNLVYKAKAANSDMLYVAVLDPDMKTIVHSAAEMIGETQPVSRGRLFREAADGTLVTELTNASGSIFEILCPVVFMNKPLGSVVIGMDKSILVEAQNKVSSMVLLVFGTIAVLGIFVSSLLASFLIRPIRALSAGVEELKHGKAQSPLKVYSQDELGRLTRRFNEMTALITAQRGELTRYARDLEEAYVSMVKVVAAAIDARDSYTHGHSARVARLSLSMGRQLGLPEAELRELEVACLLHDVGKIKTPDVILLKAAKLNQEEFREMMHHVEHGASILSWAPSLTKYIPSTRHHHEWHNGQGYPDGLSGEDIPLFAAIISIADAYDAMTSDRPYRKAIFKEEALRRIERMAGTQFRPELVAVFKDVLAAERDRTAPLAAAGAAG
ncbi:MAG: HD-GYP domain-containing protein [Desulfobacterales bacterium]|nr:HD-GYP domain-containing protein [Desulfobacterales bacterium]